MECGRYKKFVFFLLRLYKKLIEEVLEVGRPGGGAARHFVGLFFACFSRVSARFDACIV